VLIWWLTNEHKLTREQLRVLERAEQSATAVGVSAISLWEIAKLVERGRLELTQAVDEALAQLESSAFFEIIPISARIAVESTRLGARFPQDPVDQLIAATARCLALTLLTSDEHIIEAGVVATA
jgi:PIN domain nuclease of toxin-antitoxin system